MSLFKRIYPVAGIIKIYEYYRKKPLIIKTSFKDVNGYERKTVQRNMFLFWPEYEISNNPNNPKFYQHINHDTENYYSIAEYSESNIVFTKRRYDEFGKMMWERKSDGNGSPIITFTV